MGANTVRLAHYQQDQVVYDLCDRKGLIAVDRDTIERRPKESLAFLGSRKEKQ